MELVDINDVDDLRYSNIVKKVPILTDQLIVTILSIDIGTELPAHSHTDTDELHYIIKGSGKITVDGESRSIKEGILTLVPKAKTHYFTTFREQLIVMSISINPIPDYNKRRNLKSKNVTPV